MRLCQQGYLEGMLPAPVERYGLAAIYLPEHAMENQSPTWVGTNAMAQRLGVHAQTLLKLRRSPQSPFKPGRDYRFAGLSTGKLQWNIPAAELAFTNMHQIPASQVETYSRELAIAR